MGKNEISANHPRIGWLLTGQDGVPQFPGMLTMEDGRLRLTVPTPGMFQREDQPCPFSARDALIDGGSNVTIPHEVLFHDVEGSMSLIGCSPTGWTQGTHAGQLSCRPSFSVMGAKSLGYDMIQGMRVDVPALISWTSLRSLQLDVGLNDEHKINVANVRAESPESITLTGLLDVRIRPSWRTDQKSSLGEFGIAEVVEVATASEEPLPWEEHLKPVSALRDLMVVAGWRNFGFRQIMVNRRHDPQRVMSGDAIGERWAPVVTHLFPAHADWERAPRFLFHLSDIGTAGVEEWLRLRETFTRAIAPLVGIGSRPDAYLEGRLLQSGVAIEAGGYGVLREFGKSKTSSYRKAAEALLGQLNHIPLQDPQAWVDRSTKTYREVKHADNPYPDAIEMVNAVRENCLVLRCWIAARLGVPTETLKRNVELDPMGNELYPA